MTSTRSSAVLATAPTTRNAADPSIRPFAVPTASNAMLAELSRRVAATVWPEAETVADTSQGVQLSTIQKLARYWVSEHDWPEAQ